jgi:hypothetical protein
MQLVLAEGDEDEEEIDTNKIDNSKVNKRMMRIQPQPLKRS